MTNLPRIPVAITSDFICPWCYVAERRLGKVAEALSLDLDITYKPYELNPDMPKEGKDRKAYRSAKFGSWARSKQLDEGTIQASKDDPLTFHYALIEKTPNTRNAHRLVYFVIHHAPEKEARLVDAVFEGYFSQGKDIGDIHVLSEIAGSVGIDQSAALAFLDSDRGDSQVVMHQRQALEHGVQGVPHIQIGAQQLYGAASAGRMQAALKAAATGEAEQ